MHSRRTRPTEHAAVLGDGASAASRTRATIHLTPHAAADLRDAFDFLASVQLAHQHDAVNAGEEPDNHVNPKELSRLEREHLRDAFGVIRRLQQSLATKYPINQMS